MSNPTLPQEGRNGLPRPLVRAPISPRPEVRSPIAAGVPADFGVM